MNARKLKKRIEHGDVREMSEGVYVASRRGRPLNAMITVHPGRMDERPEDPGLFFRRVVRNKIEIWLKRKRVPWWAIWTRENYEGEGREHLHILAHIPAGLRAELDEMLAKWWPGENATEIRPAPDAREAFGYMIKQATSKAHWSARRADGRPSFRYEKVCRFTAAPVAPVLGKRSGLSNHVRRAVQEQRTQAARLQAQAAARAA